MALEFPLEKQFPLGSGFGQRGALAGGKIKAHFHKGQDIAAPTGTKVKSVEDGEVVRSTPPEQSGGYGNFVIVKHNGYFSAYGHLSRRDVQKGDKVKKGQLLGLVGSTGMSTGPHLHFEIRKTQDGGQVDPKSYLQGAEINATVLGDTSNQQTNTETNTQTTQTTTTKQDKYDDESDLSASENQFKVTSKDLENAIGSQLNLGDITKVMQQSLKEEMKRIKQLNESLNTGNKVGVFSVISDVQGHGGRKLGNWQSDNAWDLKAPIGTPVYSYTEGTVSKVFQSKPNNPKIFGTQVSISGDGDYPDIFYTHLEGSPLKQGDKVKVGDLIGKITRWPNFPDQSHVHIGLERGYDLGDLINKNPNLKIQNQTIQPEDGKLTRHTETPGKKDEPESGLSASENKFRVDKNDLVNSIQSQLNLGDITKVMQQSLKEDIQRIKKLM
jgi:murein DD-endopeptidase MepM/ murein hydrolase activator NlpD